MLTDIWFTPGYTFANFWFSLGLGWRGPGRAPYDLFFYDAIFIRLIFSRRNDGEFPVDLFFPYFFLKSTYYTRLLVYQTPQFLLRPMTCIQHVICQY